MIAFPEDPALRMASIDRVIDPLNLIVPPPTFGSVRRTMTYGEALESFLADHAHHAGDPLHAYVHIPLCEERCTFCMYHYSLTDGAARRVASYAGHLVDLLRHLAGSGRHRPTAALYIGGGTPSVLSAEQMHLVLSTLAEGFALEPTAGATFEMSPRSATVEKVRIAASYGINRFSFGVQSFDAGLLREVHRGAASVPHLRELLAAALATGAHEVNFDLMVGLSGQTTELLLRDVDQLTALEVPSITLYRYRPFGDRPTLAAQGGTLAYAERCLEMVEAAVARAAERGYAPTPQLDAESVRLFHVPHYRTRPRVLDRAWYLTQYRVDVRNTLLGLGSGSYSFTADSHFRYPHSRADGEPMAERAVAVTSSTPAERLAIAVVRELYWHRRFGESTLDLDAVFGPELAFLESQRVIERSDGTVRVVCPPADWLRYEKLLYPRQWLAERSAGLPA